MITFTYVRHGETIFNVTGRSQGACDSPLTENGITQAEATKVRLKDTRFVRAYSSSSERALDTAQIILEGRDMEIKSLKGLKEMSFGLLEASGKNDGDEMYECWIRKDFTAYGGENRQLMINRIQRTYDQIVNECNDGDRVLIVSHRGYFYYMLEALFGKDLDELDREDPNLLEHLIPNGSIAQFVYDGKWKLLSLPS